MSRAIFVATVGLVLSTGAATAIPPDGTYHQACTAQSAPVTDSESATLAFPEICYDGACCALSNPTRLRDLPDQFLYDSTCVDDDGTQFEARVFFGDGPVANSLVIFLRDRAATLIACDPPADEPLEDA
jgi:hypothetical protein